MRDGWRFDLGGHRFFTKVPEVEALWHEILPDGDFLLRPRMSRIFYQGKYYDYPLKAMNALRNLGLWESILCGLSYMWARIRPPADQDNYENWLVARFGWRLYRTFFKTYTERVWGVEVSQMPADWAAQRIKNLDLGKAVLNAIGPKRNQKEITSLIEEFQYPKYGPGDDVGGLRGEDGGRRGDAAPGRTAHRHTGGRRTGPLGRLRAGRGGEGAGGLPRDLDHAHARAGAHPQAGTPGRRPGGRRRACTTGTT